MIVIIPDVGEQLNVKILLCNDSAERAKFGKVFGGKQHGECNHARLKQRSNDCLDDLTAAGVPRAPPQQRQLDKEIPLCDGAAKPERFLDATLPAPPCAGIYHKSAGGDWRRRQSQSLPVQALTQPEP